MHVPVVLAVLLTLFAGCAGAPAPPAASERIVYVEVPRWRDDLTPNLTEVARFNVTLAKLPTDPAVAPAEWTYDLNMTKFWVTIRLHMHDVVPAHAGSQGFVSKGFRFLVYFEDVEAVCLQYTGFYAWNLSGKYLVRAVGEVARTPPRHAMNVTFAVEGWGDGFAEFVVSDADPDDVPVRKDVGSANGSPMSPCTR